MPVSEFLTQIGGEEFKHWGKLYQIRLSHSSETWKFIDKTLRDIKNIKEFAALMEKNEHPEGLNVTIPYKKQVIPFLNNISHEAKAIGAVNTIVWDKNGQSTGHNTHSQLVK